MTDRAARSVPLAAGLCAHDGSPVPGVHQERTADGVALAVTRVPTGIRYHPPVLLVHGTFSNASICARLADYLAGLGFDCWLLELRGHGASERGTGRVTFESFSDLDIPAAVRAVCRRTRARQVFLVGHSGGGLVALMHLARRAETRPEVRGIVTLATQATAAGASWWGRGMIAVGFLVNNLLRRTPGWLFRRGPEGEPPGVMNQWFGWNWRGRWTGADGFDYLAALGALDVPALCFAAAGDRRIAPLAGCQLIWQALGSSDKRFVVCAKSAGFAEDYDHARIIASRNAAQEVWPRIAEWLIARASHVPGS